MSNGLQILSNLPNTQKKKTSDMEKCDGTVNQVGIPSKFLLDRYSREYITSLLFSSHLKCAKQVLLQFI